MIAVYIHRGVSGEMGIGSAVVERKAIERGGGS
jgi:hypothetical protein